MASQLLRNKRLLNFQPSQACNIRKTVPEAMYYKKGANVTLGERYKLVLLKNGVKVFMLDKDLD